MNAKPLTPRQKKFADLWLSGTPAGRAWEQAGYRARGAAADVEASRAMKRAGLKAYLKEERKALAAVARIERKDIIDWLRRLIFTPLAQVEQNPDLPQEFSLAQTADGKTTLMRVKLPSKIEAIKLACHLLGYGPPAKIEIDASDAVLSMLSRLRAVDHPSPTTNTPRQ